MPAETHMVEASIQLELGRGMPVGRLTAGGRPDVSFSGWMELAAVLDALCSQPTATSEPETRRNKP